MCIISYMLTYTMNRYYNTDNDCIWYLLTQTNLIYYLVSSMKYKVTREWRKWIYEISKEEVKRLVADKCDKIIHNLIAGNMMLWADWWLDSFNDHIDNVAEKIAITIPAQMWHHIAVVSGKLYLFDCWEITEEELDIQ